MADIFETDDALATTLTQYTLGVGDTFFGTDSSGPDVDWISITLTAGQSVSILMLQDGASPLGAPTLNLYDGTGALVDNEDNFTNGSSSLLFTAATAGTYFIQANGYFATSIGTYSVSVSNAVFTNDQVADQLTDGFWQANSSEGRAFDISADTTLTVDITALTSEGQALATAALATWASVTGLTFSFTSLGAGADIRFDDENDGAYSSSTTSGGTITSSFVNVSQLDWVDFYGTEVNSYSFQTYIHEIGHALGLGHAGNYNGSASYSLSGSDNHYFNDSWQSTIMSYFDQDDNSFISGSFGFVVTPMIADIIAIQTLYGLATPNHNAGDTVYDILGANTPVATSGLTVGGTAFVFTIFDTGGTDTFDASLGVVAQRFDLNDETHSDVGGRVGNVSIARGTFIENYFGGSAADTVFGNELVNTILGNLGADVLRGGAGGDTLDGGGDTDTADYSGSASKVTVRLWNGTGQFGDAQGDTLISIENLIGSAHNDLLLGADLIANRLDGANGADYLAGLSGDDTLNGGEGSDLLDGGIGADDLNGDGGNDTADYSASTARVIVKLWNGTGVGGDAQGDTLDGIENLIGSAHNDQLIGEINEDNVLTGNGGADYLVGLSGNDRLAGGAGADTMDGGDGTDTADYSGSNVGVTVRLWNGTGLNGNAQGDILTSIENLIGTGGADTLIGSNAIVNRLEGWVGTDYLVGLSGADALYGGTENDRLDGGADADILNGGNGTDTADYSNSSVRVIVKLWNGTGTDGDAQGDQLTSIENLIGSAFNDQLIGALDQGNNLSGGDGDDYLAGLSGADVLIGGDGNDRLEGGTGSDSLTGGIGLDQFVFGIGAGGDTVTNFANGIDTVDLIGGLSFAQLTLSSVAGGVRALVTASASDYIDLLGVVLGDITAADFV